MRRLRQHSTGQIAIAVRKPAIAAPITPAETTSAPVKKRPRIGVCGRSHPDQTRPRAGRCSQLREALLSVEGGAAVS
jgi:hypothetical protein